jgi:putative chitinase
MLSVDQLRAIMSKLSPARGNSFLPFLQAAIAEFGIDAPARCAAFLAQVAHESGQLRFMEEIWGPTDAQRRYEPKSTLATRLGNTENGDGKRFKGRGPIQITGRANYQRFGDLLGLDLVVDPARAATPDVAFRIAGLFWKNKGLNELADQAAADAFREITRRINGGFNGLEDRERLYAVARAVLGVTDAPVTRGRVGDSATSEPTFERGAEAIRAEVAVTKPKSNVRRRRKPKPKARKRTSAAARRKTSTNRKRRRQGTTRSRSADRNVKSKIRHR